MNKEIEIKNKLDELFEAMITYVKIKWLDIEIQKTNWWKDIRFSYSIWIFRSLAIKIAKNNPYDWNLKERNYFMNEFWRMTTPYYFLKKDLHYLKQSL